MTTGTKKGGATHKSGFAAIVGRPNAGKSTLVNRLVGQKVAIVTSKPQTTRNRIQGIVTRENAQVVLIDTPGLHDAKTALNKQMMREVAAALEGIDVLLLMVDATAALLKSGFASTNPETRPHVDSLLIDKSKRFAGKTILVLNKIDKLPRQKLAPLLDAFGKAHEFAAIVPISAMKGEGCDGLLDEVMKLLPEGEAYFPEDQITDQPERFLASEIVRDTARYLGVGIANLLNTINADVVVVAGGVTAAGDALFVPLRADTAMISLPRKRAPIALRNDSSRASSIASHLLMTTKSASSICFL